MNLTLQRHLDPVNAFQELEDPTSGRRRGGLVDVVRHGLMVLGSWHSKSALRHRVDQQRPRHHHEQPFNPVGFFDTQRRDKKPRIFEQPKAPFDVRLPFVGGNDLSMAQLASVDLGPKDKAGLDLLVVLKRRVIRTDVGLDWPRDGLEWGARCGSTLAGVVCVFAQVIRLDAVIRPVLGSRRQGIVGGAGRTTAFGWQVQAWRGEGLMFALFGFGAGRCGTLKGRLRRHHQPALGHAIVAPLQRLIAGVVSTRLPGVPLQSLPDHL